MKKNNYSAGIVQQTLDQCFLMVKKWSRPVAVQHVLCVEVSTLSSHLYSQPSEQHTG